MSIYRVRIDAKRVLAESLQFVRRQWRLQDIVQDTAVSCNRSTKTAT